MDKPTSPEKKTPTSKVLHLASNAVMGVSALLILLEMFAVAKTYVGGLLLGIGFLLEAFARMQKNKEGQRDVRDKPFVVLGIAVGIFILGIVFLILDLR